MPLARAVLVALSLPLLAAASSASLLEDLTGGAVAYQFDGDSHHDAPDACQDADAAWSLPLGGTTDGLLAAPDDSSDTFVLDVPASQVGARVAVTVAERSGSPDLQVTPFVPGCLGSVLEPANHPAPHPSPPAPGPGEAQVEAARLNDPFVCRPNERVFVVGGLNGTAAPDSVHVAWTDGSEGPVAVAWSNPNYAAYPTRENLDITLKGAWINLDASFDGWFALVAGPCDAQDGGAVYGDPPSLAAGLVEFTPVRAGRHLVVVTFADPVAPGAGPAPCALCLSPVPVPEAGHLVQDLLEDPTRPPSASVPASCHFCSPHVEQVVESVSYRLGAGKA